MSISFDSLPSTLRIPFVAAEFDNSRAEQGPGLLAYRALLIGQKTSAGTATANTLYRVTNPNQVRTYAGTGSQLHRMALAFFAANKSTECWIGVLSDAGGAAAASGTIGVAGTATAAGTISLYVGGTLVSVEVASGDSAATIAAAIEEACGRHAKGTVTFVGADAGDNITVGGTTFVGTTGAVVLGAATYSVDTGNPQAAASFAAQVNGHATAGALVVATANSNVVTLRAIAPGTGGNSIALTSTDAVDTAVSGSGTLANATVDHEMPVTANLSSTTVTLTQRNKGAAGNEFDVRENYQDGEATPAGVTLTISAFSGGATNPTLTTLISALSDNWYHVIAHPYTDATSLTAIETELASRFGPMRMIDGLAITAKAATHSALTTLGDSRNSPHSVILMGTDSPTPPCEIAGNAAGMIAYYGAIDPARPFQTLPLSWVKAPAESARMSNEERDLLLHDGIATFKVGSDDSVQLERVITTYQLNSASSPDTSYLDATTMLTLMYARYSWRVRILGRYPRHKLANDGARFGPGQAIVTPKMIKGEALLWFRQMEDLGLLEGFDQFKRDVVVERNESDPNRLDVLLPPDIINQLIVTATKIQFLL